MVCARLNFFKIFIFIFSPRRSRRGTLGISSPGGPVEEPLKPFCSFFSLCRLSSSVVFQWGSLRQTLDLSKTTNEKVPWRRPSIYMYRIRTYIYVPCTWPAYLGKDHPSFFRRSSRTNATASCSGSRPFAHDQRAAGRVFIHFFRYVFLALKRGKRR